MMLLTLMAFGALQMAESTLTCTHERVRVAKSRFGAVATEENRICVANKMIATGHNEIFVVTRAGAKRVLVARLDSIGKIGVPLSWRGRTLIIHIPERSKRSLVQVLRPRVHSISLAIVKDYSDDQSLRDSQN